MQTATMPETNTTCPTTPSRPRRGSSEISGPRSLAQTLGSAIGALLGETGSGEPLNARTGLPMVTPIRATDVPANIARLSRPECLPLPLASLLARPVWRDNFGENGWNGYPERYELPAVISDDQRAMAGMALDLYRQACAPLDPVSLAHELATLRTRTAATKTSDGEMDMLLDSLVDDLADYPADLVLSAIRDWRRASKWWPKMSELLEHIEPEVARRRSIMAALEGATQAPVAAIGAPA